MMTRHFWFRSGDQSLLGHLDNDQHSVGVVIVPPFGAEDISSYRPLRFLAKELSRAGIATLRYDLPGTGDSSGSPLDPGLLEAWIESVSSAAAALRNAAGLETVAALGVHLGAMLALAAAMRDSALGDLVLWGASCAGRTVLRELRAAGNVERWESLGEADAPPQPLPGLGTGGFLLTPETVHALERLDLSGLAPARDRRILMLSRDGLPHDAKLIHALKASGALLETETGHGYDAMMALPHEAIPPVETGGVIARFLNRSPSHRPKPAAVLPYQTKSVHWDISESIWSTESSQFGILAEPAIARSGQDTCILYLNAGGVRHTGPNRMWVESARRWAALGVASLRLDLPGIGESDGDPVLDIPRLYQDSLVDQVEIAMDGLRSRLGISQFVLVGLCSGAFWAFHAALRTPAIRVAILLNPRLLFWDPGADQRRALRRAVRGITRWADWSRLMHGGVRLGDIRRMAWSAVNTRPGAGSPASPCIGQVWQEIQSRRQRVTLVFREGEPLLREFEEAGQLPPEDGSFVRCVRVANGGHTFRPLWAQKMIHQLIDRELATALQESAVAAR